MGSSGPRVAEGTQGKLKMAWTLSKISLLLIPLLCMGSSIEAKNWRYWPNIGCFEFSFERTVFFELTNEATRLSAIAGSELPAIVNTSVVPASDNDLQLQHILAGSIKNSTTNRPEECIISCNATGFAYAGLQDGNRCVCMNEPPTAKSDGNCNTPCPGNANFSCGGSWTMDLHQNPAYHSTNLTYIGCFKNTFNDLDRMLFEGTYNNFRNNTPDWCVAYCTSGGYDYAGLQYGSQCICTNSGPQGTSDAAQCTYGCAGDNDIKMCGGLGYINIFHTDAHKTTIDDWGCGNTVQDTYYQKWYNDMGHCGVTPGGNGKSGSGGNTFMLRNTGFMVGFAGGASEFVSLHPNTQPLPACMQGAPKPYNKGRNCFPFGFTNPDDGLPVVCGGSTSRDAGCEKYNPTESKWETFGTWKHDHHCGAGAFHPEFGLIFASGHYSKKVEISRDYGVTFETLADCPVTLRETTMVIVDKDTAFLGPGTRGKGPDSGEKNGEFYKFTLSENKWTKMTSFPDNYYAPECTLWERAPAYEKEIYCFASSSTHVFIYNVARDEWRDSGSKGLWPFLSAPSLFTYEDELYVIGGDWVSERKANYLFKMNSTGGWEETGITTQQNYKRNSVAFVGDICP